MPHVVTAACIRCKTTDCVEVCPADCFHEGPMLLVIDPDECIDCELCVPACPVAAIYHEDDLPDAEYDWLDRNRRLAAMWPVITGIREPLPDWEEWAAVPGKLRFLDEGLR